MCTKSLITSRAAAFRCAWSISRTAATINSSARATILPLLKNLSDLPLKETKFACDLCSSSGLDSWQHFPLYTVTMCNTKALSNILHLEGFSKHTMVLPATAADLQVPWKKPRLSGHKGRHSHAWLMPHNIHDSLSNYSWHTWRYTESRQLPMRVLQCFRFTTSVAAQAHLACSQLHRVN